MRRMKDRILGSRPLLAAFALFCLGALRAYPCHVPDTLRHTEGLTAKQRSMLSAGHAASLEKIDYTLPAATGCVNGRADIFPCRGVDLLSTLR